MSIDLRGTFLPVTTPFDPVTGDVDVVAFRANLRRWFEHPLRGLLIAGSTGESVFLDEGEVAALIDGYIAAATHVDLKDWYQRSYGKRLLENTLRLASPVL